MVSPGTVLNNNSHPLFFDIFLWTLFKVFLELVTILLPLPMLWFSGQRAHRILAPPPGIQPAPCTLEGQVLTIGLLRKVLAVFSMQGIFVCLSSTPRSANADTLVHILFVEEIQIATFPGYPQNWCRMQNFSSPHYISPHTDTDTSENTLQYPCWYNLTCK